MPALPPGERELAEGTPEPADPVRAAWLSRPTMVAGARDILPLSIGVFFFGLVYGVTVVDSTIDDLVGLLASFVVQAGAAQLAIVDLLEQGTPWFVVFSTALVINARFVMYSAALAPSFAGYPRRWRVPLAMLLTDQTSVTSLLFNERERDPRGRLSYLLGAGLSFVATWWVGTAAGMVVGAAVPEALQVGFAVPLMFVSLAVPSIRDRAALVAAIVGFAVTFIARDAPLNTGLLVGAGIGILAGMLVKLRQGTAAAPVDLIDDPGGHRRTVEAGADSETGVSHGR